MSGFYFMRVENSIVGYPRDKKKRLCTTHITNFKKVCMRLSDKLKGKMQKTLLCFFKNVKNSRLENRLKRTTCYHKCCKMDMFIFRCYKKITI